MKDMQEKVMRFCMRNNLNCSSTIRLVDLVSELGELSKEVLKTSSYGEKSLINKNENMIIEFGDVVFSLLCLANSLEIDAREALDLAVEKYEKRIKEKNSISS